MFYISRWPPQLAWWWRALPLSFSRYITTRYGAVRLRWEYSAVLADGVFHHMYAEFCGLHIAEAWRRFSRYDWSCWVLVAQGLMFAKRDAHLEQGLWTVMSCY